MRLPSKNTVPCSVRIKHTKLDFMSNIKKDDINVPGLRGVLDGNEPIWKRMIWTVIIIVFISLCIYQISNRVNHYLSTPITVSYNVIGGHDVNYPLVTLCMHNPFRSFRFEKWAQNVTGKRHVQPHELLDYDGVDLNMIWNMSGEEPDVYIARCLIGRALIYCNDTKYWTRRFTTMGLCHTFQIDDLIIHLGPGSGLYIDLYPAMYLEHDNNFIWKAYLHDQYSDPNFEIQTMGADITNDTQESLTFLRKEYWYKDTKSHPCMKSDELMQCQQECYTKLLSMNSTCKIPPMIHSDLPLCNNSQEFSKLYDQIKIFKIDVSLCRPCYRSCEETVFEIYQDTTAQTESNNKSYVRIYPIRPERAIMVEDFAYSLSGLFCDIGGALGLYLGVCVISLVELIETLVESFYTKKQRTHAEKNQTPISIVHPGEY